MEWARSRLDHGEMAMVERGNLGDRQPFGRRDYRRVSGAEWKVVIARGELGNA